MIIICSAFVSAEFPLPSSIGCTGAALVFFFQPNNQRDANTPNANDGIAPLFFNSYIPRPL
ncbi:hypothetical protein NL393_34445, partial [Klebsiella pneumoniae]|nr:hypothetical protein [Klebsiella pneumoniae]